MKMPSQTEMGLLFALGAREVNGRDLAKRYESETGKSISYGTLYTTMTRLKNAGWVDAREAEEGDRRVRLFKLSGTAQAALPKLRALEQSVSSPLWEGGLA